MSSFSPTEFWWRQVFWVVKLVSNSILKVKCHYCLSSRLLHVATPSPLSLSLSLTHTHYNLYPYWMWNPYDPPQVCPWVGRLVCLFVDWLVGWSVCHDFLKGGVSFFSMLLSEHFFYLLIYLWEANNKVSNLNQSDNKYYFQLLVRLYLSFSLFWNEF